MNDEHVQLLSMEYKSLRSDLQMRSSARFQFLGLITASAAVLATGLGGSHSPDTTKVLAVLGIALFLLGVGAFWRQGRDQAIISYKISSLERRINNLARTEPGERDLLSWETFNYENRSRFDEWFLGLRLPAKAKAEIDAS